MVANSDSLNFNDPQNVATVVQNRVIVSTSEVPNPTVRTTANKVNVLLSQALPGSSLRTGAGAPTDSVGVVGDIYINTTDNSVWGPKTTAGWPAASFAALDSDGGDGANVIVSEDTPVGVEHGDLWYESDTGRTFIYYTDSDTSQWVEIGIAGSDMVISDAGAPINAVGIDGQFYFDTLNERLYGPKGMINPGEWDTETLAYGGGFYTGNTAPDFATGMGGAFFLNTNTNELFGPKTFAGWPATPLTTFSNSTTAKGVSGYLGLLSSYYFGGSGTVTTIADSQVDTWIDVELAIDANGEFDYRPVDMIGADTEGYSGTGASADPFLFNLAGLTQASFGKMRVTALYDPEIDEGQLDVRLLFTPNSAGAFGQFAIAEQAASMFQGADVDYFIEPTITFFVGNTIEDISATTGTPGDWGKFQLQIRSTVEGDFDLRGLTMYVHS